MHTSSLASQCNKCNTLIYATDQTSLSLGWCCGGATLILCFQDSALKCLSKSFDGWNHYICPHVFFIFRSRLVIPRFREMLSVIYFLSQQLFAFSYWRSRLTKPQIGWDKSDRVQTMPFFIHTAFNILQMKQQRFSFRLALCFISN